MFITAKWFKAQKLSYLSSISLFINPKPYLPQLSGYVSILFVPILPLNSPKMIFLIFLVTYFFVVVMRRRVHLWHLDYMTSQVCTFGIQRAVPLLFLAVSSSFSHLSNHSLQVL